MVTYTPTPRHLVEMGSLQPRVLEACSECIRARRNILVTGVRDAGKTTLLQALAGLIPADEPVLVLDGWGRAGPRPRATRADRATRDRLAGIASASH